MYIEIKIKNKAILVSTKSENQIPLLMIIKEYFDKNGEVEFAKVLFEIKGKEYREALRSDNKC